MATHSIILAWRIPWTEEPGRLQPWGHKESDMTEEVSLSNINYIYIHLIIYIYNYINLIYAIIDVLLYILT